MIGCVSGSAWRQLYSITFRCVPSASIIRPARKETEPGAPSASIPRTVGGHNFLKDAVMDFWSYHWAQNAPCRQYLGPVSLSPTRSMVLAGGHRKNARTVNHYDEACFFAQRNSSITTRLPASPNALPASMSLIASSASSGSSPNDNAFTCSKAISFDWSALLANVSDSWLQSQ